MYLGQGIAGKLRVVRYATLVAVAFIFTLIFIPANGEAVRGGQAVYFDETFDQHGAPMMFFDPESGDILYANDAAAGFYGYTKEQLTSMSVFQLNIHAADKLDREIEEALNKERDHFTAEHRLADGSSRVVDIYAYPVMYNGTLVLFSIMHDITKSVFLENSYRKLITITLVVGVAFLALLIFLVISLIRKTRKLDQTNQRLKNYSELIKTFFDADTGFVYLKDENLKYIVVNKAAAKVLFDLPQEQIIGKDAEALFDSAVAQRCKKTDLQSLEQNKTISRIILWKERYFRISKFPVPMTNDSYGVGVYASDVTEEYKEQQVKERILQHKKLLLDMLSSSFQSKQEQLDYALHEILKITKSQYGYIYFYSEEKEEFVLNSWSRGVMKECSVEGEPRIYQLANTGIWGEVVRERKPLIVNDFQRSNPLKKGYPQGHVELHRFMSVPVIIDDQIVAVVGLGNKETDYDEIDVAEITTLMGGVWNAVQRREATETLDYERNKYYQTLLSIGDGVMVVDRDQRIEFMNEVASQLTGWTPDEAKGVNYKDVYVLSHEKEGEVIKDPIEKVFSTGRTQILGNHAILISKQGKRYHIEDSAAPIPDGQDPLAGVVLVFRDVTEKKERIKEIEHLGYHDSLTGLYNRRFFEKEMRRLDTEENLPVSIIMGDVNNLKLTNDIFGHGAGDELLKKVAKAMRQVCRGNDIIARYGGDEFAILLPKTSHEEAGSIASRIKNEVIRHQVNGFGCNISIAHDTKCEEGDSIIRRLDNAETGMYSAKTLEQTHIERRELDAIVSLLYSKNQGDRRHALNVSLFCGKIGAALDLPRAQVQQLEKAGQLHDLGRIVLDPTLLKKILQGSSLNVQEKKEVEQHPLVGYRILNFFDETVELAEAVLAHHEHWDGTGYPRGLKGKEIPLFARIIAVADTYERIANRSEGEELDGRKLAIRVIEDGAGSKFDPEIVEICLEMFRTCEDIIAD